MSTKFTLPNEDRHVEFTGDLIGSSSSRIGSDENAIRWTEVEIYRTAAGQYILHRIGKSRVFHDALAPGKVTNGTVLSHADVCDPTVLPGDVYADLVPDPVSLAKYAMIHGAEVYPDDFEGGIILESPRHKVFVAATAAGLIEAAHDEDRDRVRYITKVTERALRQAAAEDKSLAAAFLVEKVA